MANINTLRAAIGHYNNAMKNYERLSWLKLNGINVDDDGYQDVKDFERMVRQIADTIGIRLVKVKNYFTFFEPRLDPEREICLEYYQIVMGEKIFGFGGNH